MSVHASNPTESYECGQCDDHFQPPAVAGSFCSSECHTAHRRQKQAADFFETLEHDHRFCSTCGRQVKEVEKPPASNSLGRTITDAAIGWQQRTEHGLLGEKSANVQDDDDVEPDVPDLDFEDGHEPVYVYDLRGEERNVGTYADYRNPLEDVPRGDEPVPMGTVCSCGNTDHKHEDETIRSRFPFQTAAYLVVALDTLGAEDKTSVAIDDRRLIDAILEQVLPAHQGTVDIRDAFEQAVIL